jgi:hypothetical protein
MKIITSLSFGLLLLLIGGSTVVCQTTIKARTESGKEVILLSDGTWKYVIEANPPTTSVASKPAEAKTLFKAPRGGFGIWYDDTKWFLKREPDERGRFEFKLRRGDAYALVLIEELNIPLSTLKEAALDNAKAAAPDAQIIFEETRTVNKKELLCMKIDGIIKGIPFRYYGYYYGGKQGSIQLLTFTGQEIFSKYEQDLTDFLNGLEIY